MSSWILDRIAYGPPAHAALHDEHGSLRYADLVRSIYAEARWQRAAAGSRVAVLAANGRHWVVSDLALLSNRTLSVPLPAYFTADQLLHALDDAAVDAVLTDDPERVQSLGAGFHFSSLSPVTGYSLLRRQIPAARAMVPADTVKVTYTSGSTGEPKGVCLSAATLDRVAWSLATVTRPLRVGRHLCLLPLPTLLENVAGAYVPLCLGATCHVPSDAATGMSYGRLDSGLLLRCISRARPESLILVPELLRILIAASERGWMPPSSLKFIAVGGATVAPDLLAQAAHTGLPVYEGYGLSECASVVCLNLPGSVRPGSVGKALPHATVRIGAEGQIHVSGALMSGYAGERTEPQAEIATGDLGEIDNEGFVYVRGRLTNMFISSMGRNVCPEWIESRLTRDPCIAHAVVFGEGRPDPVAVLSPASAQVTDRELDLVLHEANRSLPEYAQIHRWIRASASFTFQSGLLTANGRPRRDAIAARHDHLLQAAPRLAS